MAGREGDGAPPFPAAWLSLDRGDSDPARFLTYLVVALQTISAGVGAGILAALASPQPPPTESLLSTLSNEITTIPHNFILVLDDYHLIDATLVDQALTFLIEHQPPQMHLVIATREDPQLPVSRYRARGQMTELRAADLRFTPAEAAEFLNQVMGLSLSLFPRHHGDHHTLRDWPQPGYFGSGFVGRTAFWTLGLAFGVIFLAALLIIGVPYLMATVA